MRIAVVVSLALSLALGASTALTEGAQPAPSVVVSARGVGDFYKIVRAEYIALAGNGDRFDTTCHIINTNTQSSITLREVYVLGPGGVNTILATFTGLSGVMVPPLGHISIPINNTIPGLMPQTALGAPGVRSVVVGWWGSSDAMQLSAVIQRDESGNTQGRAYIDVVGHDLTF